MSKLHRLEALRKRIRILRAQIEAAQNEHERLAREASLLTADLLTEDVPEHYRNYLMDVQGSENSEPRKPVVRE